MLTATRGNNVERYPFSFLDKWDFFPDHLTQGFWSVNANVLQKPAVTNGRLLTGLELTPAPSSGSLPLPESGAPTVNQASAKRVVA